MKALVAIALSFFVSSCTLELWMDNHYTENIGGFYIEKNSNSLVAIGENYHYIFDVNEDLIEILESDKNNKIRPNFHNFKVNKDNKITGKLSLSIYSSILSEEETSFFVRRGFNRNIYRMSLHINISGTRYSINESLSSVVNFKDPYKVKVADPFTNEEITKNILLTPVTIVGDAGIIAIALPLGVLYGVLLPFN